MIALTMDRRDRVICRGKRRSNQRPNVTSLYSIPAETKRHDCFVDHTCCILAIPGFGFAWPRAKRIPRKRGYNNVIRQRSGFILLLKKFQGWYELKETTWPAMKQHDGYSVILLREQSNKVKVNISLTGVILNTDLIVWK